MSQAWRIALIFVAGSLVILSAGALTLRGARQEARVPYELQQARQALDQAGGEDGIRQRQEGLTRVRDQLTLELLAKRSDSAEFSRHLDDTLAELGLTVTSSSEWLAAPEAATSEAATFEREFQGVGSYAALFQAITTIESWPDQPRVREVAVTPEAVDRVSFSLRIAVTRLPRGPEREQG